MKNVKWTDNVCTVGGTCIHGYFNLDDLKQLFGLCPNGDFTPTFYHEKLGAYGFSESDIDKMREIKGLDQEFGYYFTFMEKDGGKLITFLKEKFPMVRGEGCF